MNQHLQTAFEFVKNLYHEWQEDNVPRQAAALSYFTIFSIAPLLILVISVAGFFLGREAVQAELLSEIRALVGEGAAEAIENVLEATYGTGQGIIATVIGLVTLIFGATGVVQQLKVSLNNIWDVRVVEGRGVKGLIMERIISFSVVLGIGFLLLVSLVISALLPLIFNFVEDIAPGIPFLVEAANFIISFLVIMLLFAMIYKVLPDVEIEWRDVWIGAAFTSLLFNVGKWAIGLYIGNAAIASAYGAAGALVVILLWIYYSALILFLGAEFTQVYARMFGSHIQPADGFTMDTPSVGQHQPDEAEEGGEWEQRGVPPAIPEIEEMPVYPVFAAPQGDPVPEAAKPSQNWFTGFLGGLAVAIGGLVTGILMFGRRSRG